MKEVWVVFAETIDGKLKYTLDSFKHRHKAKELCDKFNAWNSTHQTGKFAYFLKVKDNATRSKAN